MTEAKKRTKKQADVNTKNRKTTRLMIVGISQMLMDQPFMADEPNDNTDYEHALSIQTVSAINLIILLVTSSKSEPTLSNLTSMAMFMRALIEVSANINYFSLNRDDQAITMRFLNTAKQTREAISNMKTGATNAPVNWSRLTISRRIRLLDKNIENLNYTTLYRYLSSFVHSDAGYLNTMTKESINVVSNYLLHMVLMCVTDMVKSLDAGGVIQNANHKYVIAVAESLDIILPPQLTHADFNSK